MMTVLGHTQQKAKKTHEEHQSTFLPYPFQTIQIIVGHYTAQQSNGKWMETRADPVQIQTEIDFYNAMRIGQFYSSHSAKMIHIGGWWMVRHWILASNDRL